MCSISDALMIGLNIRYYLFIGLKIISIGYNLVDILDTFYNSIKEDSVIILVIKYLLF